MVNRSTLIAYGAILFTAVVLVWPTILGHYALFELTSLRPLSTMLGTVWVMLAAISIQLAEFLEAQA